MKIVLMRRRNGHRVRKNKAGRNKRTGKGIVWLRTAAAVLLCGGLVWNLQTQFSGLEPADTSASKEPEEPPLARKVVALTFDDGPHKEITPQVLDILKDEGVPATFFLMGENAQEYPKLVKRMVKEGHEVGNHTYSHVDLSNMSRQQAREEVERAQEVIEEITGERPALLRPPFGKIREDEAMEEFLLVSWNVDTLDWCGSSAWKILSRVQKQIKPGSIILMHDQYPGTVEALPELIRWVKEQGYEFVTVEELLLL